MNGARSLIRTTPRASSSANQIARYALANAKRWGLNHVILEASLHRRRIADETFIVCVSRISENIFTECFPNPTFFFGAANPFDRTQFRCAASLPAPCPVLGFRTVVGLTCRM